VKLNLNWPLSIGKIAGSIAWIMSFKKWANAAVPTMPAKKVAFPWSGMAAGEDTGVALIAVCLVIIVCI
jgi:hypothetical protein